MAWDGEESLALVPTGSLGPWGRACRARIQRAEADYGFRARPRLIGELREALLRG